MIALDTNVLVRFLVRDDERQARAAHSLIDDLSSADERAYVSDIVLCEVAWVLGRSYRYDRVQIAGVVRKVATARQLSLDSVERVLRAVAACEAGRGFFADYLVREHARAVGRQSIRTFDSALLSEEMFISP